LGDTLAKIAAEKAGIIKSEGTVVVAPQEMEALTIIEERCLQQQARLILVGRDYQWRIASDGLEVRGLNSVHSHLYLPLLGDHQIVNAVTAIAAAEALAQYGYIVSHEAIQSGLATVSWPGRLEMLRRRPLIIADGAHNADSARKLSLALPATLGVSRAHIILGTSSDKDVEGIVRGLAPVASTFTLVRSRHPRAAPIEKMEEAIAPWGVPVSHSATVADALESLRSVIPAGDTILVTGSLFVVAEAREALGFRSINRRYRR
jgi:dihydrofolate synthase/folylpolyglutamate synthase